MSKGTGTQLPAGARDQSIIRSLYGPIGEELQDVERLLQSELKSDYPYVDEMIRHGCLMAGKRLRPALLLLTGKATGTVGQEHTVLAAVVEMIHTATLVHDDVLDEADTRRHLATVNSRWDSKASVLLGDFLFTHAFYLASTLETTWACREIGRATNIVCEGELRQKGCRGEFTLSEAEYLSIIEAKTAELCACSCQLGAYYAGADANVVENMSNFGRELGIAFQIADDMLDLMGDEGTTGKSLGTDLEQQKPTLPLIRALQQASEQDRRSILAILVDERGDRREALRPYLDRFGALEYARDMAIARVEQARDYLQPLPETAARNQLLEMTDFVVSRRL